MTAPQSSSLSPASIAEPAPRAALSYPALVAILGGGQLARMTAEAAARLGIEVAILEREPNSPAARMAARSLVGAWDDYAQLLALAEGALAVTLENEFVDAPSLEWLAAQGVPVFPAGRTLALVQDKLEQKRFMQAAGIPMPLFAEVSERNDILRAGEEWGWPLVLKARRNGYDGYGNATLRSPDDIAPACERLGWPERALLVEAWVPFERELAVMVARGAPARSIRWWRRCSATTSAISCARLRRSPLLWRSAPPLLPVARWKPSAASASSASSYSRQRQATFSIMKSRRVRTIPDTTPSRAVSLRSSRITCAQSWDYRWAAQRWLRLPL